MDPQIPASLETHRESRCVVGSAGQDGEGLAVGKVRLVVTGNGSLFGDCLYEQVLDQDDFGVAAAIQLGAV